MIDWSDPKHVDGLIPAIVQDATTGQILMLGYMNRESFDRTLESGLVTFFSRSRQELWTKGETSGNRLEYVGHEIDCDSDTLLVSAKPSGPVCHTGSRTCFVDSPDGSFGFFGSLERIVSDRADADPAESYTARLLNEGPVGAARKVAEEGVEVTIAAISESDERLTEEAADLVYHLVVTLRSRGLSLADVAAVLERRHAER